MSTSNHTESSTRHQDAARRIFEAHDSTVRALIELSNAIYDATHTGNPDDAIDVAYAVDAYVGAEGPKGPYLFDREAGTWLLVTAADVREQLRELGDLTGEVPSYAYALAEPAADRAATPEDCYSCGATVPPEELTKVRNGWLCRDCLESDAYARGITAQDAIRWATVKVEKASRSSGGGGAPTGDARWGPPSLRLTATPTPGDEPPW